MDEKQGWRRGRKTVVEKTSERERLMFTEREWGYREIRQRE